MSVLISLWLAVLVAGQASPPQQTAGGGEAPAKYQIGAQDVLKITVLDETDLTGPFRVDSDGYITYPYLNRIAVAGLTLSELQEKIRAGLAAGFLRNPQVRVEIESYKSQSVMVSGEVRTPGKLVMSGSMSVLEALAAAGSPTSTASSELTIAHAKKPGDAESEVIRVNWKDLQLGKGTDAPLQDGDIINVPKAQTFYITGQVKNPGLFVLDPGMTVQQAIALAGGLNDRGSDRRITASRLLKGKLTDVGLKLEDRVMPNDVITIAQRLF